MSETTFYNYDNDILTLLGVGDIKENATTKAVMAVILT